MAELSDAWECGQCHRIHTFDAPVRPPAPCACGCIGFKKVNRATH